MPAPSGGRSERTGGLLFVACPFLRPGAALRGGALPKKRKSGSSLQEGFAFSEKGVDRLRKVCYHSFLKKAK